MKKAVKHLLTDHWGIIIIFTYALVVRLINLERLTTFSGDQGYDFLQIKSILSGNLTLLGPKIGPYNDLGNLYLGPAYYYILAPFLLIFNYDPIGAAFATVLFSVLTILLIYILSLKYFSKSTAIIASLLYTVNPFLISQSRAPSNPHLIPFFSALAILSILNASFSKSKNVIYSSISGFSTGIIFQLHYQGVILLPIFIIFLILQKKTKLIIFLLLGFLLSISGQIIFEIQHNFFVTNLIVNQLIGGKTTVALTVIGSHFLQSFAVLNKLAFGSSLTIFALTILLVASLYQNTKLTKNGKHALALLTAISIVAFISIIFYSGDVNAHYLAIIYPAICILFGLFIALGLSKKRKLTMVLSLLLLVIVIVNSFFLLNLDAQEGYTMPKGWNLSGQKEAARKIVADEDSGSDFNVASNLDGDTRAMPMRYLLAVYGKKPLSFEQYGHSKSVYLLTKVSAEEVNKLSEWEITSFAPFNVINLGEIQNGIYLYKLKKS